MFGNVRFGIGIEYVCELDRYCWLKIKIEWVDKGVTVSGRDVCDWCTRQFVWLTRFGKICTTPSNTNTLTDY